MEMARTGTEVSVRAMRQHRITSVCKKRASDAFFVFPCEESASDAFFVLSGILMISQ